MRGLRKSRTGMGSFNLWAGGGASPLPRLANAHFCRLPAGIFGLIERAAESTPPTTFRKDHAMTHSRVALLAAALLVGLGSAALAQMIVGPAAGPPPGMGQAPPPGSSGMIVGPAAGPSSGPGM